jgi:hypothetical protein
LPAAVAAGLVLGAGGDPPEGCHDLRPEAGPYRPWGAWTKPANGAVVLRMQCTKCHAHARDSTQWGALMRRGCGVTALRWDVERHELAAVAGRPGWWSCTRCGLQADVAHRTSAAAAKCPVRCGMRGALEDPLATSWHRRWVAISGLWITAAYGKPIGGGGPAPAPVEAPATAPAADNPAVVGQQQQPQQQPGVGLEEPEVPHQAGAPAPAGGGGWLSLRWTSHLPVRIPGVEVCLRCGCNPPRTAQAQRWRGEPCGGELAVQDLPGRVAVALSLLPNDWVEQLSEPTRGRARAIRGA